MNVIKFLGFIDRSFQLSKNEQKPQLEIHYLENFMVTKTLYSITPSLIFSLSFIFMKYFVYQ